MKYATILFLKPPGPPKAATYIDTYIINEYKKIKKFLLKFNFIRFWITSAVDKEN